MKTFGRNRLLFLAALATSTAICGVQGDTGSIFKANEYDVSIFGESANGNVDSQPEHNLVHGSTTVTVSTTVAAPTTPVPTPTPTATPTPVPTPNPSPSQSPVSGRKPSKRHTHALAATGNGGTTTIDPSVKKTFKTRRVRTTDRLEHNAGGGGITFNYFFTRYIGIGLEGDFLGGNPYDTVLTGNLIFRYPFEFGATPVPTGYSKDGKDVRSGKDGKDSKSTISGPTWGIAPYILLGGGSQWDGRAEGIGDVGGGVELRFKQHWGFFLEGRWVIHDSRQSYGAETAGFSYIF
jgi:hypothetical protein